MKSETLELPADFLSAEAAVLLLMRHFDSALDFDSLLLGVSESKDFHIITTNTNKITKNTSKPKLWLDFWKKKIFPEKKLLAFLLKTYKLNI